MGALAIDVGTSFVEGALIDVEERRVVAHARTRNQQVFFGTNVITRLSAAVDGSCTDLQILAQESVLDAITHLEIGTTDDDAMQVLSRAERIVVAANSVMAPLFCGVVPKGLVHAPFTAPDIESCTSGPLVEAWRSARDDQSLVIEMLEPIAAFVGGDARAALIATGLNRAIEHEPGAEHNRVGADHPAHLLVDLGTNAEIMLRKGDDLFVTSVPAGPTFEGLLGIGGAGLRGTDVIEMMARHLESGDIDKTGLISPDAAPNPITQTDVRELQLAKAAVRVGIDRLLEHAGVTTGDVDEFWLVGAFGAHLDPAAAGRIGLYPPTLPQPASVDHDRLVADNVCANVALHNAALIGAMMVAERASTAIAGTIHHIDLASDEAFMGALLGRLDFPDSGSQNHLNQE